MRYIIEVEKQAKDTKVNTEDWIKLLLSSRNCRLDELKLQRDFYYKRRFIDYGIRFTITTTLLIWICIGGPPVILLSAAAALIGVKHIFLSWFKPKESKLASSVKNQSLDIDANKLEACNKYRHEWLKKQNEISVEYDVKKELNKMKKIAISLVGSYFIFAITCSSFGLFLIVSIAAFIYFISKNLHEEKNHYIENEKILSNLIN